MMKLNRVIYFVSFLVMVMLVSNVSLVLAEGNGGYAGAYLRLGLGARAIAMGNAQVATADHGFGFYYNPAALPYLEKLSANFSYSFLSLDRRFAYVGLSTPIKPQAGFSIGWIFSGVGDIKSFDSHGVETGKVDHGQHAIYFSFGSMVIPDRLSVGVSAKYLRETLSDPDFDYTGKGFSVDLGAMFRVNNDLSLGFQVKDINGKLKSNTNNIFDRGIDRDNAFPVSSRLGFYYISPVRWARVAYDFEWSTAGEEKNHIGLEFTIPGVAGRIGYDNDHLTFGGGLVIDQYSRVKAVLNYAFVASVVDEGASHIFTWQFSF